MKNITITLDEETVAWARIHAAERKLSLSRYVGEVLRDRMRGTRAYDEAMRAVLSEKPMKLSGDYPSRDSLHERSRLR